MGQTLLTSVAVTVNGSLRDVSAPSGTTLQTLLNHMQIAGPAIDLDGRAIPGSARLGVDLPAGTLITILPAEWGQTRRRQVKNIQDTRGGQMYGFFAAAGLAAGLTVVAALVASYWQAAGRDGTIAELTTRAGSLAATPWLPLALAGVLFAVSLGFSLMPPNGRPLVEILPGTTFAVAASLALGLANPGDVRHQLLIVTLLAVGSSAFVRWVTWGHKRRTGGGVLLDVALASAIVAGLDLVFLSIGLPFELFIAGLLGILPALLAALGALTVRVDSEALVETSAVIREAPSVRRSTEQAELPEPTELVWLSSLRHKLWTILTSATIVAASAVMVRPLMSEGIHRTFAIAALACIVISLLLIPRTSRYPYVRIVPRAAAAIIAGAGALLAADALGWIPVAGACLLIALAFIGISYIPEKFGVTFTRLADILQSLTTTLSLPLTLVAIGIIDIVRTGGLP